MSVTIRPSCCCRQIPPHPWLSPGLTNAVLATAPPLDKVEPQLAELINGRWVVGHNVNVDLRLLGRQLPALRPAGLIDTFALARALDHPKRSLSALLEQMRLTELITTAAAEVSRIALSETPWQPPACCPAWWNRLWPDKPPTLETLRLSAGIPLGAVPTEQPGLFE